MKRIKHLQIFARAMYTWLRRIFVKDDEKTRTQIVCPPSMVVHPRIHSSNSSSKTPCGTALLGAPIFWILTRWTLTSAAAQFEPICNLPDMIKCAVKHLYPVLVLQTMMCLVADRIRSTSSLDDVDDDVDDSVLSSG